MIEILALIFLCQYNGRIAIRKGLPHKQWWLYTVLAWLTAEIFGLLVGFAIFGAGNLIALMGVGLFCAFGGYLFIRNILENKPDPIDEDINQIGVDDLRPPRNQ